MIDIRANLERVRERVARAAERAGRRAGDVLLVGVSKTVDVGRIRQAIEAGVPALGENRVQEARGKVAEIGRPVPWHLVGHLQTNKVRDALELFDVIQSLDRLELAKELDKRARARGRTVDTLVEVNVGGETSKGGVGPDGLGELLEAGAPLPALKGRRPLANSSGGEGARRLARVVPRAAEARRAPRPLRAVDGDERRFRGGDRGGRDGSPGRHRDLWTPSTAPGGTMTIKGRNVGFLGAGNMGEALIKGLLGAKLVPAEAIHATDVRLERLKELDRQYGIQVSSDNTELVRRADIVILAVKPQIMESVLKEIAPAVTRRKLPISIAAGVSTAKIRTVLHKDARLI